MRIFGVLIIWISFSITALGQNSTTTYHKSEKPASGNSTIERDTISLNGRQLIKFMQGNSFRCLTTLSGDTIVKYEEYYANIDFLDIDGDGYKDIRVFVFSNTPNQCDNYFFDKVTQKYMLIEDCDLDITLIKGTRLFYSYNKAGCGGAAWESHLCKIENWKEVDIGYIDATTCADTGNVIKIYKLTTPDNDSTKKLIKEIPIQPFTNGGIDNKWAYIRAYWVEYWPGNYKLFE